MIVASCLCTEKQIIVQVETFKKLHGEDQMAVDKLKEGIDGFAKDQVKLEQMIHEIVENSELLASTLLDIVTAQSYLCCFHTGHSAPTQLPWHCA